MQSYLVAHGIEVRRQRDAVKYHAKYIVADDTALIASLNFTGKCFARTCDFMLVTADAAVVSGLNELFAADWAGRAVMLTSVQAERLIVGPEQRPRERFASLVRAAQQRIRLIDAKLADPRMLSLLDSRRRAGVIVDVKGHRDLGSLAAHGKLLIVDDATAVIGSIALSENALEARRELAVVTHDRAVIRELDQFWHALPGRPRPSLYPDSQPDFLEVRP